MKTNCGTSLFVATAVAAAGFTTMAMANDECSTAVTLTVGVPAAFDTSTATVSADPAPSDALCAGTFLDWGTANKDVWFKWTASEAGLSTWSTCTPGATNGDTSIALYSGSCGSLTQVACNGDAPAEGTCQQFFSKISGFQVTGGTTYYLRVGGWNGDPAAGQLTLTFQAASEGCIGATGDCRTPHGGVGCNDAVCCTAVCAANPLCCDPGFGWDAQCVQDTTAYCGFFIYTCSNPAAANDCATGATVFAGDQSFVVSNTGYNTDGPDHPASTCSSGNDVFLNDVWFRTQAVANGSMRVNTCNNTNFDTKLAVYNMGTNPAAFNYNTLNEAGVLVGCNDDGSTECQVNATYASDLTVGVNNGNWYLIRVATYDLPGTCTVFIDSPEPCALDSANGSEGEACGEDTNGGCNATIPATTTINPGQTFSGSFWADAGTRDTDWYSLSVGNGQQVTVTVKSNQFNRVIILGGACGSTATLSTATSACGTVASSCLNAGNYFIFVGMADAAGNAIFEGVPCGSGNLNDYSIKVEAAPASCPVVMDQVCTTPGANTFASSTATAGGGLVACAVNAAFPNCTNAGTTVNTYARPMPAGAVGGSITCLDVGVFAVKRGANATNTACANYASDLPLPSTIGVYEDIDGGAPRNKIVTEGDGNDLRLIEAREVLIPGGAYVGNIDFDPPLCLEGVTGNIVVIMDCPDLYSAGATPSIPDASGYGVRPGGGTVTGQSSGTYVRLSCADAAAAYVPAEQLGATFTAQWIVTFKGDFAGCDTNDCPADLNGDNIVNAADLAGLLGAWGTAGGDLNGDGITNAADLAGLLGAWGACP